MEIVRSPKLARATQCVDAERASKRRFFGVCATLFAFTSAVTIVGCSSMSSMGEMPMPGGWTMSMTWMKMPGQTWAGAAASFVGMWVVMMKAMMLPSLTPMLWRYRLAVAGGQLAAPGDVHVRALVMLVGAGYFFVWTLYGVAVFAVGTAFAAIEMQWPALARTVPFGCGAIIVAAGALQFTAWKAHHLVCCREVPRHGQRVADDAPAAWRHGMRLGLHCGLCTAGLTAVLLVLGVMDLRVMALVTIAITVERIAPDAVFASRAIGAVTVGAGLLWLARAGGLA